MKILIVEDEPLVAMLLEGILDDLGHMVVGPAGTLKDGLALAQSEEFDAAILDVNLRGARSFAIADLLKTKAVPHFFATGYGSAEGVACRGVEIVRKPFREDVIAEALNRIFGSKAPLKSQA
jgi:CheY-like chemotaxis protein